MVSESDFITIPYTTDMTLVGIKYALGYTRDQKRCNLFNCLRQIVAETAVALAFKRYLNNRKIPHDMLKTIPFTDPDHYDVAIGGRRCAIKSFMVSKKRWIRTVRKEPNQLLGAQALVPVDQTASDHLTDDDILIFAFLAALIAPNQHTLKKALAVGQPIYMIHTLPQKWTRPELWGSLGTLTVKSNNVTTIELGIGGLDVHYQFQTEKLILNHQVRMEINQNFSALSYLFTPDLPDGAIGLHSSTLNETYLVEPLAWKNIWIYGMEIIFSGYITRGEYRKKASRLPNGSRVFQNSTTRTENFSIPVRDLHPLGELFERAKIWHQNQKV